MKKAEKSITEDKQNAASSVDIKSGIKPAGRLAKAVFASLGGITAAALVGALCLCGASERSDGRLKFVSIAEGMISAEGRDYAENAATPEIEISSDQSDKSDDVCDADNAVDTTDTADDDGMVEPETTDDEEDGEFVYTPYMMGLVENLFPETEGRSDSLPPLTDENGNKIVAVTTTTAAVTTKAETTTKKVTTRKTTTVAQPDQTEPDVSGITDKAAAIVEIAKSQVGVREKAYNNVKYNTWFYGKEVRDRNSKSTTHAWCVVFISWCADRAGIPTSVVPKTAGVWYIYEFYKDRDLYHTRRSGYVPNPGDIVIFSNIGHAGIVESCSGSTVTVIEGNYSDSVVRNTYSIKSSKIAGYASPEYN